MRFLLATVAAAALLIPAAVSAQVCPDMHVTITCNPPSPNYRCDGPTTHTIAGLSWQGIGCIYQSEILSYEVGKPGGPWSVADCQDPDRLSITSDIANFQGNYVVHERFEDGTFLPGFSFDICKYSILTSAPYQ